MNGHVLTAEEFVRHYSEMGLGSEYASITCDGACEQLTLKVGFPLNYDLQSLEFRAIAEYVQAPLKGIDDERLDRGETTRHDEETGRIFRYLKQDSSGLVLTCPEPVPGLIYKICWKFRRLDHASDQHLAASAEVSACKNRLVIIAQKSRQDQAARSAWNQARSILDNLVSAINGALPPNSSEALRVNVMVFDEASNRLRFVCANTEPDELPLGEFFAGEGCAGFVFEKGRCLLYHPKRDPLGYFIHQREWAKPEDIEEPVVLASFPWIHKPQDVQRPYVLGVVNVSSAVPNSKLLQLFDLTPDLQKTFVENVLQELVNVTARELFIMEVEI